MSPGPVSSGLSNCGYTDAGAASLRSQWAGLLNEHHLLGDLEKAFEFRDLSERRVPEHTPFFVFGLWLVEAVGGGDWRSTWEVVSWA